MEERRQKKGENTEMERGSEKEIGKLTEESRKRENDFMGKSMK